MTDQIFKIKVTKVHLTGRSNWNISRDTDLIEERGITTIWAESGAGKTWLAVELCRRMTSENEDDRQLFANYYHLPKFNVLYLDAQNGVPTMATRLTRLGATYRRPGLHWECNGHGDLKSLNLNNEGNRNDLFAACSMYGIDCIVFDCLENFIPNMNEKQPDTRLQIIKLLRQFTQSGYTVIVLHQDDPRGNFSDLLLESEPSQRTYKIVRCKRSNTAHTHVWFHLRQGCAGDDSLQMEAFTGFELLSVATLLNIAKENPLPFSDLLD